MTSKSLILAGIFAAITTSSFATGENTVTSKSYVDAMDATKQDKVTAGTTGSVVTYNGTDANGQAQFDERAIFDLNTSGEWDENDMYQVAEGHEGDLMTAGDYWADINSINSGMGSLVEDIHNINGNVTNNTNQITNINNQLNAQTLEPVSVQTPITCANPQGDPKAGIPACSLWTITSSVIAHKLTSCTTANTCPACGTGTIAACVNNVCKCNACSGYNISASSASQCCSGYLISGNKCGCTSDAECVAWLNQQGRMPSGTIKCKSDHTCGSVGSGDVGE